MLASVAAIVAAVSLAPMVVTALGQPITIHIAVLTTSSSSTLYVDLLLCTLLTVASSTYFCEACKMRTTGKRVASIKMHITPEAGPHVEAVAEGQPLQIITGLPNEEVVQRWQMDSPGITQSLQELHFRGTFTIRQSTIISAVAAEPPPQLQRKPQPEQQQLQQDSFMEDVHPSTIGKEGIPPSTPAMVQKTSS